MSSQVPRDTGMNAPAYRAAAITPSDTTDFDDGCNSRAIYVGVTGDLVVYMAGDSSDTQITIKNAAVGYHPIACRRVLATGTTATQLVRLW